MLSRWKARRLPLKQKLLLTESSPSFVYHYNYKLTKGKTLKQLFIEKFAKYKASKRQEQPHYILIRWDGWERQPDNKSYDTRIFSQNQKDRDEKYIYLLMLAYRFSVHESTKVTPNEMVSGRQVTLPIELLYGKPTIDTEILDCCK